MPRAKVQYDPELLLRDTISGIAVTAYSRGIAVAAHVDNRLPCQLVPEATNAAGFLRRGLLRTIEAGHSSKIALGLWLEKTAADGIMAVLLEVCRALGANDPPVSRLADLWALPLGAGTARPAPARQDAAAESVLIPLGFTAVPDAPAIGARRGGVFRGRRLLHVRDVLFDRSRLKVSMAEIGADVLFAPEPDEALAIMRESAAEGRPIDIMVLDGHALGPAAAELARRVRADPELARTRVVLASAPRGAAGSAEDAALFDVSPGSVAPWMRLLDVMHDLFRSGADTPAPGAAAIQGGAIPVLAGKRILVAEDVATNQVLLRAILAPTGAAIEVVPDGAMVVERHRDEPADLIVMDLQMPGVGGVAALHGIRALGGAAGAIPVVALTAYAHGADRRKALAAGMDAYLAKPIVVAEFYQLLRQLIPDVAKTD